MSGASEADSVKMTAAEIKNLVRDRRSSEIASVSSEEIKDLLPSEKRRELNGRLSALEKELEAKFGKQS